MGSFIAPNITLLGFHLDFHHAINFTFIVNPSIEWKVIGHVAAITFIPQIVSAN